MEDPQATGIAVAEVDLAALSDVRARMPIAVHRMLGRPCLRPAEGAEAAALSVATAVATLEQQCQESVGLASRGPPHLL